MQYTVSDFVSTFERLMIDSQFFMRPVIEASNRFGDAPIHELRSVGLEELQVY